MAEPVTRSTANETPTMENPTEAGASSRSASSSRKSRIASTGNRRTKPPRDIGLILPISVPATPADAAQLFDGSQSSNRGAICFPS